MVPTSEEAALACVAVPLGRVQSAMRCVCDKVPTVEEFGTLLERGDPALLKGAFSHSPALLRWRDLDYFRREYGHRYVPVEIGIHKTAQDVTSSSEASEARRCLSFREEVMTMRDFLERFFSLHPTTGTRTTAPVKDKDDEEDGVVEENIGYLAQHALLDQISELRRDVSVPAYCADQVKVVNAWFGTGGTVTPLHYDSYDNLLTQVVGYKYVRLYTSDQTPYLYPHVLKATTTKQSAAASSDGPAQRQATAPDDVVAAESSADAQGNISSVNVEEPDLERYPLFQKAQYQDCILAPGDMLFIPQHCWHFVRSLSPSFSLSFWW